MIFVSLFLRALRFSLPLAIGWLLGRAYSMPMAAGFAGALAVVLPTAGALLLRTLQVGRMDWRNYAAGWLMPFGYALGRGKLVPMAAWCVVIWFALAACGVLLAQPAIAAPPAPADPTGATVAPSWPWPALVAGWLVLGTAFLHLFTTLRKNFSPGSRQGRSLLKVMAVVVGLVAASVALHVCGFTGTAALVALGPPGALGTLFGLWFLLLITFGRNARWN